VTLNGLITAVMSVVLVKFYWLYSVQQPVQTKIYTVSIAISVDSNQNRRCYTWASQ